MLTKPIIFTAVAALGFGMPSVASAKVITFLDGDVTSGSFGDSKIAKGDFTDTLSFSLSTAGQFVSSITSIAANLGKKGDVDFTDVFLTGPSGTMNFNIINNGIIPVAFTDSAALKSYLGAGDYTLTISGYSYGNGSFGGDTNFTGAVPELETWAMMILGLGAVGSAMRYRRRKSTVAYAA